MEMFSLKKLPRGVNQQIRNNKGDLLTIKYFAEVSDMPHCVIQDNVTLLREKCL